jgi:hypothetical protein
MRMSEIDIKLLPHYKAVAKAADRWLNSEPDSHEGYAALSKLYSALDALEERKAKLKKEAPNAK